MSTIARQLGAQLAALRTARGVSRRRLGRVTGLAANTLGEIEHGAANPTLKRVEQIAAAYDAHVTITITPKEPTA